MSDDKLEYGLFCYFCGHSSEESCSLREMEITSGKLFCTLNPEWVEVEKDHWCSQFSESHPAEAGKCFYKYDDIKRSNRQAERLGYLNRQVKLLKSKISKLKEEKK